MNHRYYRQQLSALHDGELSSDEESVMKDHLVRCEECAALLKTWRLIGSGVRSLEEIQLPAGFSRRVLETVREDEEETSFWMPVEALARKTVFGLSLAVIVLVAFLLATEPQQPVIMESYLSGEVPEGNTLASLLQRESISKNDILLAVAQK